MCASNRLDGHTPRYFGAVLPHLDEPLPPSMGQYHNEHTKAWADKIASFDGFVIVTPEYKPRHLRGAEERH